jgi:hypothetical protein
MTKRQIVQITGVDETIAALCNDGSVWLLTFAFDERRNWRRLPDIPQTNVPPIVKGKDQSAG